MAARDYKRATSRAPSPPAPLGSWVSFVTGLGLGLLVALAVYMWTAKMAPPSLGTADAEPKVEAPKVNDPPPGESPEAALEPPRPKFDFYKILPEMEVPVQDWEKTDKEAANEQSETPNKDKPALASAERGAYVLQIGSYKQYEEADQAKARLAMQGITANIQRVVINGQDVWFRVHVGPLSDANDLRTMRLKLKENKTDFIVLKIGGSGTT